MEAKTFTQVKELLQHKGKKKSGFENQEVKVIESKRLSSQKWKGREYTTTG